MFTTLEQTTEIWKLLNASSLKTSISGGVYKNWRPDNSEVEDVVVNGIIIDNEQIQTGIGNVNIHVPDVLTNSGLQPDAGRLEVLAKEAVSILKEGFNKKYTFFIENQGAFKDESAKSWFINIRFRFRFHNTIT